MAGSPRHTADERRAQILRAAVAEFGRHGYVGATTAAIARRVGLSQPYLFRHYPTKKALFLAACEVSALRLIEGLRAAASADPEALRRVFRRLLADDPAPALLLQVHMFAACDDPDIREAAAGILRRVFAATGVSNRTGAEVLGHGLLCTAFAAAGWPGD